MKDTIKFLNRKLIMRMSQNRFCKKFLGILFFGERVYMDIHDEPTNKITTKFTAKCRFCDSLIMHKCGFKNFIATVQFLVKIKIDKFFNGGFGFKFLMVNLVNK